MHFKAHMTGGVAAGLISAAAVTVDMIALNGNGLGSIPLEEPLTQFLGNPQPIPASWLAPGVCFFLALALALFPDLDIHSIPQRWYLRGMFAAMVTTWWLNLFQAALVLGLLALLPLLHRHRGWTHWKITPWLIAMVLMVALEAQGAQRFFPRDFEWRQLTLLLWPYWPIFFSCVLGHSTHLILDSRYFRDLYSSVLS